MASPSDQSRSLILYFSGPLSSTLIDVINLKTDEKKQYRVKCDSAPQLFALLPSKVNIGDIKAFIFCLKDFGHMPFVEAYKIRIDCHYFCKEKGIYYFFTEEFFLNALAGISSTKTMIEEGQEILFNSFGAGSTTLEMAKIIRENNSYRIRDTSNFILTSKFSLENPFLKNFEPKKVIILQNSGGGMNKSVIKCFKKKFDPIILSQTSKKELLQAAIVDKILHLMGEKINPFDIVPHCAIEYRVFNEKKFLFGFKKFENVPTQKSVILEAGETKNISIYPESTSLNSLLPLDLPHYKSKKLKLSLSIDINSIYGCRLDIIKDENHGERIPPLKIGDKSEKARIIFDKQNFSVFVFANGNREYKILDSDGLDQTPIFIAFNKKKPIIGKAAMQIYGEKSEFVVFDLIKLCSIASADVMSPKWKFNLFKDDDNKIMVSMQTLEGEKQSNVEFLLALIIRNAINRIKEETGERMSELEIGFDGFEANEMLKKNFVEAGKLKNCKIAFVSVKERSKKPPVSSTTTPSVPSLSFSYISVM